MNLGMPTAIINGIDEFGGRFLAEELLKKDINVIGIGGEDWWDEVVNGVEFRTSVEEVDIRVNYIFDFLGDKKIAERARVDGAKLAVIGINKKIEINLNNEIDWRKIWLKGVYGKGIEENIEIEWFTKILRLAVSNKNLILPKSSDGFRLMAIEDGVEVILRATLLSGTSGEEFEVWGEKYSQDELVKILIDEAKMTRFKVIDDEINVVLNGNNVENIWSRLRWEPKIRLKNGIKEVLQYFFTLVDEESRRKIKIMKNPSPTVPLTGQGVDLKKKENKQRVEVVVEEEEEIEEEPKIEIKPLLNKKYYEGMEIKNSNARPVAFEQEKQIKTEIINSIKEKTEEEKIEKIVLPKKRIKIKWKWLLLGGIGAMVLGVVYFWGSMAIWWTETRGVESKLMQKKYEEANGEIKKISNNVDKRISFMENSGLVRIKSGSRLAESLKVWRDGLEVMGAGVDLAKQGEDLSGAIFGEKEIDWDKQLALLGNNVKTINEKSGLVEARLGGDWSWLPAGVKERLNLLKRQMAETRQLTDTAGPLLKVLPKLVGVDGKRKEYMILFQNENELRPTGGFIGSYGILSFEGGKLLNLTIKDVYEADGQLKGHVEPPDPIKTYLNEAGYYMRDANWDVNFPTTVKNVEWFLEKETGMAVDGVIGVNLAVAKSILEATGEISVPDFSSKVNKDNLYEQAEFYSEKNSFPGSVQKEFFLGSVGKQLFEEVKVLKPERQMLLVKNMLNKLEDNEIQISVNDLQVERELANLGWNGEIYTGKCPSTDSGCFADYVYIVEANLGVNKANYYVYRNVDESVDIGTNSINRVLKINYENTSKNSNWPGGVYKNYLRVYIPESANIAEVSVTDPKGIKTIYRDKSLSVNSVYGKKEIGILVEVPVMSKRTVEIRYVDAINLVKNNKFSYLQYVQKQSGFGDTGWVTLVSFPDAWEINQVQPEASMVGGKILFNQKLTKDIKMGVELTK